MKKTPDNSKTRKKIQPNNLHKSRYMHTINSDRHNSPHTQNITYIRSDETRTSKIQKQKKSKNYSNTGRVLGGVIFSLVLVYLIGYTLHFLNREKVSFETLELGHISASKPIEAVIIRDETVYRQTRDGAVYYNVYDRERVRKGMLLYNVRDEEVVSEIETNLEAINKEIFDKQKSRDKLSLFAEDVKRVNSEVSSLTNQNIQLLFAKNVYETYDFYEQLQKKIDSRNQMLLTEERGTVAQLVDEKQAIQKMLSENLETVAAIESGVFSNDLDGFEEQLKAKEINSITENDLKIKSNKAYDRKDGSLFKIVTSNDWYIAGIVPAESVLNLTEGDSKKIYIENYDKESLDVSVYKIIPQDDRALLILKSRKNMIDFIGQRTLNFEMEKPREGYKIPNTAIVEQTLILIPANYISSDGYVYKLEDNSTKQVQIYEAERDADGNVYASLNFNMLKIGDILQNPMNKEQVYTIEKIKTTVGVFIINSGIADFKSINTSNMEQNDTHTVIDPALNPGLMVYDRIISDAKKIEKGQIINY